jgi:hypothetical protein
MSSPSESHHCTPCKLEEVNDSAHSTREVAYQASLVKLFAGKLVAADNAFTYPSIETVPPVSLKRHMAALDCASTIIAGECPFFIYEANDAGNRVIQARTREIEFGTLRAVE